MTKPTAHREFWIYLNSNGTVCACTSERNQWANLGKEVRVIEMSAVQNLLDALERLTKVGPPSKPTSGADWAAQCLKDNCEIAKAALTKFREGRVK